ncbi:MAG: phosphatase PAP2 family protein [Dehalococcoidia bacterium]
MTVRQLPIPASLAAARPFARLGWAPRFIRDFAFVVGVVLFYFLLRGQAGWDTKLAMTVSGYLVDFERATRIFWEPQVQELSIRSHAVQEVANFVYAYLHFPVLIVVGAWLWFRGRHKFLFMRNVMFISMVIGLAFYFALPAAPPRLMALHGYDLGFVDTVFGGNTAVSYAQPAIILNEYAAIPSFHFGWITMASAAIWVNTGSRVLRSIAVVLSVVMGWAIVASANHFFVDMALGSAVVAVSWVLAQRLELRRRGRAPAATALA